MNFISNLYKLHYITQFTSIYIINIDNKVIQIGGKSIAVFLHIPPVFISVQNGISVWYLGIPHRESLMVLSDFMYFERARRIVPKFSPVTGHGQRKKCIVFRPSATPGGAWDVQHRPQSSIDSNYIRTYIRLNEIKAELVIEMKKLIKINLKKCILCVCSFVTDIDTSLTLIEHVQFAVSCTCTYFNLETISRSVFSISKLAPRHMCSL